MVSRILELVQRMRASQYVLSAKSPTSKVGTQSSAVGLVISNTPNVHGIAIDPS